MTEEEKLSGTAFDDTREVEGEWFSFFGSSINEKGDVVYEEAKPGAGRARIRSLISFFESKPQRKKKYEWVLNTATRAMERVGYFEDPSIEENKKERDDTWDYAITGLENFSIGGRVIECTREGKIELMKRPMFDRFVARCLQLLASSGIKMKEEETKN